MFSSNKLKLMDKLSDGLSENEDDPLPFDSKRKQETKKRNKRRSSKRLCKKSHLKLVDKKSDESGDDCNQQKKRIIKRHKTISKKQMTLSGFDIPSGFKSGSFLILKKDARSGYKFHQPCIWKIDGKALLQKFEPFLEDGILKHRNTSIYTGWSVLEKDLYAPIYVHVALHVGQKMIVQMNFDQLKEINMESD